MSDFCTDFTKDGKCSGCGECCSNFLPISEAEKKRIKDYIKKHNIKAQVRTSVLETEKTIDLTCPFRDNKNKICTIYEVRPAICRSFLCSHSAEDIKKAKLDLHQKHEVCFMRTEFFGDEKDESLLMGLIINAQNILAAKDWM